MTSPCSRRNSCKYRAKHMVKHRSAAIPTVYPTQNMRYQGLKVKDIRVFTIAADFPRLDILLPFRLVPWCNTRVCMHRKYNLSIGVKYFVP